MPFVRPWDSSCPRVWDQWEVEGTRYVIQDLPPEDDDLAATMLLNIFVRDEPVSYFCGVSNDPVSMRSAKEFWDGCMRQRTSLACYAETDGGKQQLVGFNCCIVLCQGEKDHKKMEGESWTNVLKCLDYVSEKADSFKFMGVDKLLYGMGLFVDTEYRKAKIGTRILQAREALCKAYGIKGSSTVFTGVGSQTCAARAGFVTTAEVTWKELADAGLNFPRDGSKSIKLMVRKYDDKINY